MRFSNSLIIHEQNTKKSPPYRLIVWYDGNKRP
jgi:hypothetical protein